MFKILGDIGLRKKILIGYMIIILILICLASWAIYNFISLNEAINAIMVENYQSVVAAEEMMESLERKDSAQLIFIFGQREKGLNIFKEHQMEFMKFLSRAEDNVTIPDEKGILETINGEYQHYLELFSKLQTRAEQESLEEVQTYYLEEIMPKFETIKQETRELLLVNQNHMKEAQQRANTNSSQAVYSTIAFSLSATVLAIIFGIYLSNIILKPIKELTTRIEGISAGDFEHMIQVDSEDEVGQLANEFNSMTQRLKEYEEMNVNRLVEEKNKSEAIVKSISNPLLVTDDENKILLINPKAEELFGVSEAEVSGDHFLESIGEDKIFGLIKKTLESGKEQGLENSEVIKFPAEEGKRELYFRTKTTPVNDKSGTAKLVVTILEDITYLKEVDEMKSEFVSMVSHEFRTPLTSMSMSLNMLLAENVGEINDEQRELLEVSNQDCEHLNELVDDLLDLSKIESGEIDLDFDSVSVAEIFAASVRPFEEQAVEQGVELKVEDAQDLEVYADLNKITWVITNLIGNALRYTSPGDQITLGAVKKGHRVHISVTDTGQGIPKKYQHNIFDKFVRVGDDRDESTGTGLGLAISKEMIEAHGGRIWVESEEGEGSTFIFTLKLPN